MNSSKRWREFITWWKEVNWQFNKDLGCRHLVAIIDNKIEELKLTLPKKGR